MLVARQLHNKRDEFDYILANDYLITDSAATELRRWWYSIQVAAISEPNSLALWAQLDACIRLVHINLHSWLRGMSGH